MSAARLGGPGRDGRDPRPDSRALLWLMAFAGFALLLIVAVAFVALAPESPPPGATAGAGAPGTSAGGAGAASGSAPATTAESGAAGAGGAPAPAAVRPCWRVESHVPEEIPLSLKNTYRGHDFLYWLKLRVENQCDHALSLRVSMEPDVGLGEPYVEFDVARAEVLSWQLRSGEPLTRGMDENFDFLKVDATPWFTMGLTWTVRDKARDLVLDNREAEVRVMPYDLVDWDLRTPDQAVPKAFLLASLSAWVINPPPPVRAEADALVVSIDRTLSPQGFADAWFARLYHHYFGGDPARIVPINLSQSWLRLPPAGQQTVSPPARVLETAGRTDSLEAALLLASLTEAARALQGTSTALLVHLEGQPARPSFVFAWSVDGRRWKAFTVSRADRRAFEENQAATTAWLGEQLEQNAHWREALSGAGGPWSLQEPDGHGVLVDEAQGVVGVAFRAAADHYRIRGLP